MKIINVPTGKIIVAPMSKGDLEFLSIGDYGKDKNIKADFLGHTDEICGVPNGDIMPLESKWVITISTQYGCAMKCKFCDVPMVGSGKNATFADMVQQISIARAMYPKVKETERLNIHFARMGEPTFNPHVIQVAMWLKAQGKDCLDLDCGTIHPVLTSMLPRKNKHLEKRLKEWVYAKNLIFGGEAGLQLSINSTNDSQRNEMYEGCSLTLNEISHLVKDFPPPVGRKYCLNFALADDYEVYGTELARLFNPDHWMVKITPIHVNSSTIVNMIETSGGYETYEAYKEAEKNLKRAGFDVLVFVPSLDEDDSMITCGNAILSGRHPTCEYTVHELSSTPGS